MDPSIMKFLEEDEDETMHSGADVDAFTAALNRDIQGQFQSPWQPTSNNENTDQIQQEQPEQHSSEVEVKLEPGFDYLHQEDVASHCQIPPQPPPEYICQDVLQTPQAMDSQCHDKIPMDINELGGKVKLESVINQHAVTAGMHNHPGAIGTGNLQAPARGMNVQHASSLVMKNQQAVTTGVGNHQLMATAMSSSSQQLAGSGVHSQQLARRSVLQQSPASGMTNQKSVAMGINNQQAIAMGISNQQSVAMRSSNQQPSAVGIHNQQPMNSGMSSQPVFNSGISNQQAMSVGVANQQANSSNRAKQVPFARLLPILTPLLDKDRGMQLVDLYKKLKGNEIAKETFVRHMRAIVGDPILKRGVYKIQQQVAEKELDIANSLMQSNSRVPSAPSPVAAENSAKTAIKKPSVGQKMPLEALDSSPPPSGKKQKASGAGFLDQSIDHLNDVTLVSGVDLREEEEQLFSGPKEDNRVSESSRRLVQEEEDRLLLQKTPLKKKLAEITAKSGLKSIGSDVEKCLSLCVEERMRGLMSNLIRMSKQRVDIEKSRHRTIITTDVRKKIMTINQKVRVEREKKLAEEEKLQRLNEPEESDGDKEKDESRARPVKVVANKEENEKMRTTAANVAARAAVGGSDMLLKWKLMAEQSRQEQEGETDEVSGAQADKDVFRKTSTAGKSAMDHQESEKRSQLSSTPGSIRKLGRNQVIMAQNRVARAISVKDVIAVLKREPQMLRSTLMYRLYDKICSESSA